METPGGPAMVSTLREAEYFAAGGRDGHDLWRRYRTRKLDRVAAIRKGGANLAVILDSIEQAQAVAAHVRRTGDAIPVLIEVDADGHRSGVAPDDTGMLVTIGKSLGGAQLRGVLLHAGDSYSLHDPQAIAAAAEAERKAAVMAAGALRAAGLPCPVVSVGSTPTARYAEDLTGITEVRAGVFMFGDLFQAGVTAVRVEDIALTVLATVIGHQRSKGWTIIDAGWMAMSRDRGTAKQAVDQELRHGLRPVGQAVCGPYHRGREPGARHRGCGAARPRAFRTCRSARACASCRTMPAPPARNTTATTCSTAMAASAPMWPRINGWAPMT